MNLIIVAFFNFCILVEQTFFYVPYVVFRDTHLYIHDTYNIISTHLCTKHIHQIHTSITRFKPVIFYRRSHTDVFQTDVLRPTFSDRRSQTNVFWSDVLIPTFFKQTFSYRHFSDRRSQTDILRPTFFGATFSYRHFSDRRSQTDIFTFFCTMLSH